MVSMASWRGRKKNKKRSARSEGTRASERARREGLKKRRGEIKTTPRACFLFDNTHTRATQHNNTTHNTHTAQCKVMQEVSGREKKNGGLFFWRGQGTGQEGTRPGREKGTRGARACGACLCSFSLSLSLSLRVSGRARGLVSFYLPLQPSTLTQWPVKVGGNEEE